MPQAMEYHFVAGRPLDLSRLEEDALSGVAPRSSMAAIVRELDAKVHDGAGTPIRWTDRLLARLSGTRPVWWATARAVRDSVKPGDVIYCTGEDVGMPTAVLCARHGARIAVLVHRGDSRKKVLAFRATNLRRKVALFIAVSEAQVEHLRRNLGLSDGQAQFVWDQTDTEFFSPGNTSVVRATPIVMSVGLEMRDYSTLADATADKEVAVRISAFSADTRNARNALPAVVPANMERRFYPWPEFRQLYRDASVVVVSLYPNSYAAGVQALMEGLACGRPIVATRTEGLGEYLEGVEAVRVVPPGDSQAMWAAIEETLKSPTPVDLARNAALERHRFEAQVSAIAGLLQGLSNRPST